MEWIKTGLFAHRGLHDGIVPENTLWAFKEAVKNGYDIELDIRLTKDNKLVVFHDQNLYRLCGVDKDICTLDYEELKAFFIKDTKEQIPLLSDLLKILPHTTTLLIELKSSRNYKKMVQVFLDDIRDIPNQYAIHSYDPRIVYYFKRLNPHIIRGLITKGKPTESKLLNYIIKLLPILSIIKPDFINHEFEDLPNKTMDLLKEKGYMILSYTAHSLEELNFIKHRYDNAVFEGFKP